MLHVPKPLIYMKTNWWPENCLPICAGNFLCSKLLNGSVKLMTKFHKLLVRALAASLMGLFSVQALAITVAPPPLSTFDFSGNCEDCAIAAERPSYAVTARLVLQNYFQGDTISAANFVSFDYGGSNLLPAYSISSTASTVLNGSIPFDLPTTTNFYVGGNSRFFYTLDTGRWNTGMLIPTSFTYIGGAGISSTSVRVIFIAGPSADMGGSGTFSPSAPNAVPEPSTLLLLGAALAAAGMARRQR